MLQSHNSQTREKKAAGLMQTHFPIRDWACRCLRLGGFSEPDWAVGSPQYTSLTSSSTSSEAESKHIVLKNCYDKRRHLASRNVRDEVFSLPQACCLPRDRYLKNNFCWKIWVTKLNDKLMTVRNVSGNFVVSHAVRVTELR